MMPSYYRVVDVLGCFVAGLISEFVQRPQLFFMVTGRRRVWPRGRCECERAGRAKKCDVTDLLHIGMVVSNCTLHLAKQLAITSRNIALESYCCIVYIFLSHLINY